MKRFSKSDYYKTCQDQAQIIQVPLPPSHAGIMAALRIAFQQLPDESPELTGEDNSDLQDEFRRLLGRLN